MGVSDSKARLWVDEDKAVVGERNQCLKLWFLRRKRWAGFQNTSGEVGLQQKGQVIHCTGSTLVGRDVGTLADSWDSRPIVCSSEATIACLVLLLLKQPVLALCQELF